MNQHLIRARGVPTEVPEHHSQLYLDLDTKYHWISVGNSSVEDWVGPIMTEEAVNQLLNDFASGTGRDPGTVVHRPVVKSSPYGRHVTIDVKNRDGRFNVITDDATGTERLERVTFMVEPTQGLDIGTMFSILNETAAELSLYTTDDIYRYAGQPNREIRFFPGNLANFKLLNVLGNTRYWLVWGDYDKDADSIGGKTIEEIIEEIGLGFVRLESLDEVLDEMNDVLVEFLGAQNE